MSETTGLFQLFHSYPQVFDPLHEVDVGRSLLLSSAAQNASAPSPTANSGARIPRSRRVRSRSSQDCVFSR